MNGSLLKKRLLENWGYQFIHNGKIVIGEDYDPQLSNVGIRSTKDLIRDMGIEFCYYRLSGYGPRK